MNSPNITVLKQIRGLSMFNQNLKGVTATIAESLKKSDITDFLIRVKRGGLVVLGLTFPAAFPLSIHGTDQPFHFSRVDILNRLYTLKNELNDLISAAEAEKALRKNEYLTTKEFAYLVGLDPKTISNRASAGKFRNIRRENGLWYIHKSELDSYE